MASLARFDSGARRPRWRLPLRSLLALLIALAGLSGGCGPSSQSGVRALPGGSGEHSHKLQQASAFATDVTAEPVRGEARSAEFEALFTARAEAAQLILDGRLADLALAVAEASDGAQRPPSYALVRFHAHRAGIAEPTPQVWLASGGSLESLLPAFEQALGDAVSKSRLTHAGAAAAYFDQGVVVALALSLRALSLQEPIPRSVPRGARVVLRGELAAGYGGSTLAITDARGAVSRSLLGPARTFARTITFAQGGETTLELLATGPQGLAVIAVLPVMVGAPFDTRAPELDATPAETDAAEVALHLFAAIQAERQQRKLPLLRNDPRLAKIALAHSTDMVEHGFIAHTSKLSGDASARVRGAGLKALLVLENIGRGYSASELHRGLMESPGHRGNILQPDAREIGIGVVAEREGDRDAFLVTELFTQLSEAQR